MRSSIRWALIAWYGVLLAAVLAAFGTALYLQASKATYAGVDSGLGDRARALAAAVENDPVEGWELELSEDYLKGLSSNAYFRVWSPGGALLRKGGDGGTQENAAEPGLRTREDWRELAIATPEGVAILVGRSIRGERAELARLLAGVIGAGLGVLALGLLGGLWLARRTLAPVGALTHAVSLVSPRDLTARLDEREAPLELRELARAFNATLDRLEAALLRQKRFTADASHELRTPLAVVRAQVELALKEERTAPEYRSALEACRRATLRMTGLVDGLLALAEADSGEAGPGREEVSLDAVARETAEMLGPAANEQEVTIRCAAAPTRVQGDRQLLADVVTNLVSNGVRYNRRGGSVEVSVASENGHAVLRVSDTGIGIPIEAQSRLFERFYRVDPARSRAQGGAGLGLAIAHRIVEAHHGSIEVESRVGWGSTFTVRLPSTAAGS